MQSPIFLPEEVLRSIREHVAGVSDRFPEFYESASENEDTLTGDFLGHLRSTKSVSVDNREIGGTWTWRLQYTKLRGSGPRSTENIVGADGILELEAIQGIQIDRKAALFQSKMDTSKASLLKQASK